MKQRGLIQPLAAGPLDVIGDVHGEVEALDALLRELGYDERARHPDGRKLVFVGDLCDRGPDSIAVIQRVQAWIAAGRAQCVLGNHELNLLRDEAREGNGWFFEEEGHPDTGDARFADCQRADAEIRADIVHFLLSLPLVLEREDLRVVHACPDPASLQAVRASRAGNAVAMYIEAEQALRVELATLDAEPGHAEQQARYRSFWRDQEATPELLPLLARRDARYQNGNPVRVLTSGIEQPVATPFFSTGRWRLLGRVRWWEQYDDPVAVIFGHYWRRPNGAARLRHKGGIHGLFDEHPDEAWLGPAGNAFCVDHCVGLRFAERAEGVTSDFGGRLSAMRWPERELVMDNGRRVTTGAGAGRR